MFALNLRDRERLSGRDRISGSWSRLRFGRRTEEQRQAQGTRGDAGYQHATGTAPGPSLSLILPPHDPGKAYNDDAPGHGQDDHSAPPTPAVAQGR